MKKNKEDSIEWMCLFTDEQTSKQISRDKNVLTKAIRSKDADSRTHFLFLLHTLPKRGMGVYRFRLVFSIIVCQPFL
jgi:hypothetical protein